MDFLVIAQGEERLGAPAKVPCPELGEVSGRSLKIRTIPAVFDNLAAYFFCGSLIRFGVEAIFPAGKKNPAAFSEICQRSSHVQPLMRKKFKKMLEVE